MSAGDHVYSSRRYVFPDGRPQPGDIVITRLSRSPVAFAVGVAEKPPQIAFRTYDEALRQAREFARWHETRVWRLDGERRLTLVARYGGEAPLDIENESGDGLRN